MGAGIKDHGLATGRPELLQFLLEQSRGRSIFHCSCRYLKLSVILFLIECLLWLRCFLKGSKRDTNENEHEKQLRFGLEFDEKCLSEYWDIWHSTEHCFETRTCFLGLFHRRNIWRAGNLNKSLYLFSIQSHFCWGGTVELLKTPQVQFSQKDISSQDAWKFFFSCIWG